MRKSLAFVIAGTGMLAACTNGDAESGGPTVSRNYQVGSFQEVELAGHYDVEIRTGSPISVNARGPENVLNRLRVEVDGNKLTIGPKNEGGWFHFGRRFSRETVHVTVTVPTLTSATLAGSGVLNVDKVQGGSFEGTVAGSGQLNLTSVDVQSLKLNIAGSGSAKAGQGKAQSAEVDIAGSGNVDAGAVHTNQVKVSIAGSGGVRANASNTATVDIMGSGDVDISGGAKCTVSKAGAGNVRCS
ncbi:MAG TPA: head GIN domain-containing protein [Sphingomicrobium sp.]|nr:head GIN domain-containing protein [Sphingomicrobium sp.]